jgi:cysteinyl-tRNA synthetase
MTPGQQGRGAWFDSMELKLYDTLTREKRVFTPLDPANVRMYVCGPTVYDFAHIGNARPVIVFDVLFRLLRHLYGADHVTYARNITDVDDKINARAAEEYPGLPLNEAIRKVTKATDRQFHEDVAALGCLPPTVEPRATEHIAEMRALIERLVASGNAYVADDHVLFSVGSMPDYGRLSKRPLDEMIAGARVEVAPYKRDPMDFVLWKPSKPGEPAWPSPCGIGTPGRPGWHIECSAMSDKWLWTEALSKLSAGGRAHPHQFDIHGGGIDLVFPHHENEIAQSRSAFRTPAMANFWMHNGFLQVEGEKMSKSLGNFVTIHELEGQYPGDVLRLSMLSTHYRQPIDWTHEGLENARKELLSWSELVLDYFYAGEELGSLAEESIDGQLIDALVDDLNTPLMLTRLREIYRLVKAQKYSVEAFVAALRWIGIRNVNKPGFFHPGFDARLFESGPKPTQAQQRDIIAYRAALANGSIEIADRLLSALSGAGFVIQVNDAGTIFVRNKTSAGMVDLEKEFRHKVEEKIAVRNAARKEKNFAESDRIREELAKMGVALKDSKDGTTWEIAR